MHTALMLAAQHMRKVMIPFQTSNDKLSAPGIIADFSTGGCLTCFLLHPLDSRERLL